MQQPELGKKIVFLRKQLGLTQEELAARSSLGLRTVQRIESGGVMPRNSTIDLLLKTLGKDRQSIEAFEVKAPNRSWVNRFFLLGEHSNPSFFSVIQTAWIAGIFYLLSMVAEYGLEYLVYHDYEVKTMFKLSYVFTKFCVLIAFTLFIRGFVVLARVFENMLLSISTYVLIGVMSGLMISDVVRMLLLENETLDIIITMVQSIIVGAASLFFGVALVRSQDSLGLLAKYAGIAEIIIGVLFMLVFLSPMAMALLVPETILEVIILYKGAEFIKSELISVKEG